MVTREQLQTEGVSRIIDVDLKGLPTTDFNITNIELRTTDIRSGGGQPSTGVASLKGLRLSNALDTKLGGDRGKIAVIIDSRIKTPVGRVVEGLRERGVEHIYLKDQGDVLKEFPED